MWGDLWRRKREEGSQKNKKIKNKRRRRREKRENLKKCVGIGKAKEALGGWEKLKIVNIKKEKRKMKKVRDKDVEL